MKSYASSPRERPTARKGNATRKTLANGDIGYSFDLHNPPPLNAEQVAELKALAAMPDSEIDFSDIPPLDENFWQHAVRNPFFYKPVKASTTVRIDADVLAWLRSHGKGYQSRINAILRREMLVALQPEPRKPAPAPRRAGARPPVNVAKPLRKRAAMLAG